MLKQISIKNFAIFEDASFEPGEGYNVITGESGAGKSIVVNALSLIRGARAYREMIRTGKDYALVEAVFELSDEKMKQLDTDENILVITRRINSEKISECRINDKIRPLSEVVELTGRLIDIHGQYENQTLADSENHLAFLDAFAGMKLEEKLSVYRSKLREYNELVKEIIIMSGSDSERERNKEIYNFQLNEINTAGLEDIPEEELLEKWNFMKNAERFLKETEKAYDLLESDMNSPYAIMTEVHKLLASLPENTEIKNITGKLNEASFLLLETISELRDFTDNHLFDKYEYDQLSDTIENIKKLKRKYGASVEDILLYRDKIAKELEAIENYEKNNSLMLKKVSVLEIDLLKINDEMMEIRKESAKLLKEKLLVELNEMSMRDSDFIINLKNHSTRNSIGYTEFGKNGLTGCEFLISLNKGLEPQPLGRVASGGEMSRIMLAFKTLFTFKDETETVVFDEIDSGLSGEASKTVAAKLGKLSEKKQIICITHLPQIAALKGNHFVIWKETIKDIATAGIDKAETSDEVIRQIASLTDGENLTEEALRHAGSLYRQFN